MKLGSLIALQNSGALEKIKTIEMDGKRTLFFRGILEVVALSIILEHLSLTSKEFFTVDSKVKEVIAKYPKTKEGFDRLRIKDRNGNHKAKEV